MESESGVNRSMIDELNCWDIQGNQMEGKSGVTQSVIDELHSWDIIKGKVKVVVLEI